MKKIAVIRIACLLLVALFSILAFVPLQYVSTDGRNWMSKVDNEVLIHNMHIPGTHNSGATHSIGDVSGRCQTLSIKQQLDVGVRFLDIRLKLNNDELVVVHDFVDQRLKFSSVVDDVTNFIRQNKSEFLILSIKEDSDPSNSTIDFSDAVKDALSTHSDVIDTGNTIPQKIKDARGKIFILSRFDDGYGIPARSGCRDNTSFALGDFYVQDCYCIDDINYKKRVMFATTVSKAQQNGSRLVLNFTSCYIDGGFPPLYAGTPAIDINDSLLRACPDGILACDFMTENLAKSIYERNGL
jgi:1-phosphatidylinositol phosphodiesterase